MKNSYIIFFATLLLSGCESFTEIDTPKNNLVGESVYKDKNTAEAALATVYSRLFNEVLISGSPNGLGVLMGAYSDELTYYRTQGVPSGTFYLNQLTPLDMTVVSIWDKTYSVIFNINAVIKGVESSTSIIQKDKNLLLSQAYFCRAYLHYFLLELYNEVPYVTSTDYQINSKINKLAFDLFYEKLTNDLKSSEEYFFDVPASTLKVKPNIDAVKLLKSRIELQNGNYSEVIRLTSEIIFNNSYSLETDLDKVFLKESNETIWQLMPPTIGGNALEGASYIFTQVPPPTFSLNDNLYNSFELNDQRKLKWIKTLSNNTNTYAFSYKYKQNQNTATSLEYSIQFRLAEAYLLRGEAYIKNQQLNLGLDDVNKIRNRAGLSDVATLDSSLALNYLQQEKRHELFCEHGHRFFDLKRWGLLDAALSTKPNWQTVYKNLPLPEKEILLNPNLKPQNNGY